MADEMENKSAEVAEILKTLAHPGRLLIACTLVERELSVGQIEDELGIRQPALSRHLKILKTEQVISSRKQGVSVFYHLSDRKVAALIRFLYETYCRDHHDPV
ncbi:metalloregulator ArsR/SmtB family transcription factor [Asaia sp. BMEF1]|uniref:metalloregulator ArsR/SmtB family transcription factor n=1 Tax=Asaia sp. BMEF1 TaxID=3155932 RepID=UPI003F67F231